MTLVRRTLSALGALISLAVSVPAAAACRDRADATEVGKRLAERGYEELAARRYGASEASFRASLECYESPASRFYLGRSLELQHKLLDALKAFEAACRTEVRAGAPESWEPHRKQACAEQARVAEKIPSLEVRLRGARKKVVVTVDGATSGPGVQRVDPGVHEVRVEAADGTSRSTKLELAAGESRTVTFRLASEERTDDAATAAAGVGFGIGAAGLIMWIAAGGLFLQSHGELSTRCPEGKCPAPQSAEEKAELDDRIARTEMLGDVATAGLVIAIVGAAAGTTALLLRSDDESSSWEVRVSTARAVLRVRW